MDRKQTKKLYAELFSPCPDWGEQALRLDAIQQHFDALVRAALQAAVCFTRPSEDEYEFRTDGDIDHDLAIRGFRHALDNVNRKENAPLWGSLKSQLGIAYKSIDNERKALPALRSALEVFQDNPNSKRLMNLLVYLGDSYVQIGKIKEAIATFEEALSLPANHGSDDDRAQARMGLGLIYLDSDEPGYSKRLVKAIKLFESASQFYQADGPNADWAYAQSSLGFCYSDAQFNERALNVETAISHFQNSLRVYDKRKSPEDWARVQLGLGIVIQQRAFGVPSENVSAAITALKLSLKVYRASTHPDQRAMVLITLGALYVEGVFPPEFNSWELAIKVIREALSLVSYKDDPATWTSAHLNIGNAYASREKGWQRRNLKTAEEHLKLAASGCLNNYSTQSGFINVSLGCIYIKQHGEFGSQTLESAITAIKTGLTSLQRDDLPHFWMQAQANLAIAYMFGDDWRNVFEIAEDVLNASDDLLHAATSIEEQIRLIKDIADTVDLGTLAKVQLGNDIKAFAFACRARARFLRFLNSNSETKPPSVDRTLEPSEAYFQFCLPSVDELGLVFVVTRTDITVHKLLGIGYEVRDQLFNDPENGWLTAYRSFSERGMAELGTFSDALERTLSVIGKELSPVLRGLSRDGIKRLIISPSGVFSLIPIHMVDFEDKLLLEAFETVYTPDLETYLTKTNAKASRHSGKSLIVSNPSENLHHAEQELQALETLFSDHRTLAGDDATLKTVLQHLREGNAYNFLHFACHGSYGWAHFDSGGLELANSERLTFKTILHEAKLRPGAVVVLAACESGVTDYELMRNETFGLQLAFLHAGAGAVISTLWPVDDLATRHLMRALYEGLKQGLSPSVALRNAQLWMRNVSNRELYGEDMPVLDTSQTRISNQGGGPHPIETGKFDDKPFSHPVFWAGFTVYGKRF